jgi:hypothetical protein
MTRYVNVAVWFQQFRFKNGGEERFRGALSENSGANTNLSHIHQLTRPTAGILTREASLSAVMAPVLDRAHIDEVAV